MAAQAARSMTLAEALDVAGWPQSLAEDASKAPTVLEDAAAFVDCLLWGKHVDDIVVLRGGVSKLSQDGALPDSVARAVRMQPDTRAFLGALDARLLESLRGRVYCTGADRREWELRKSKSGAPLDTLLEKRRALAAEDASARVYVGELRRKTQYRHALDNRHTRTLLFRDVKDYVGKRRSDALPYWDRYDEGVFIGGRYAGSPMHVDQIMWSNVGKSFGGAKLLAIWASGEASREIFDQHHYTLFTPPLGAGEAEALEAAAKVALLLPGDCVLFSGGNAHMAMSVSDELSATAYESFVNLHPANLRLFLDSGTPAHYRQCRTRRSMLEDIKTDVAESCADLIDDVRDGIFEGDPLLAHAGGAIELLRSDDFVAERIDERHRKRAAAASAAAAGDGAGAAGKKRAEADDGDGVAGGDERDADAPPAQKKRRADEPPRDRDAAAG